MDFPWDKVSIQPINQAAVFWVQDFKLLDSKITTSMVELCPGQAIPSVEFMNFPADASNSNPEFSLSTFIKFVFLKVQVSQMHDFYAREI